ncbi:MAG TPA: SRPBCC family protein, partial [Lacipirellulaceae bacterium]|nr:SRPBCC family protein [Lacipirellulaceae bacterium]
QDVVDDLEVHDSAENISALQGGAPRTGEPVDVMQANWSPTTRLLMGAAGTALMMRCATRRTPAAALLCPAGFAMAMRAVTNLELGRAIGAAGGRHGTTIQKTTTINRPVEEVFEFLSDKSNYPRITDMITSVKELGDGRIQKTIAGPGGFELTVEERFTSIVPNEFLAVRSEPNSPIQYALSMWFEPEGDSSTRVHIQATYNPPGGVLAHSAAWLAGMDIKSLFDDVMMRAKSYLESGKQPHDAAQAKGRERQHAGHHDGSGKSKPTKASGESTGKPQKS